jgi:O-antigen/teichoic acid export membrane protein
VRVDLPLLELRLLPQDRSFSVYCSRHTRRIFPVSANLILIKLSYDLVTKISDQDQNRHFRTDHLQADLGGRSARGGAVTLSAQLFKFVLGTASTIVLARLLTPEDYGLIGMVAILISFLGMFQYMGLPTATIKWTELDHQLVTELFWINVALSTSITVLTIGSAPVVAWFYDEPRLFGITIGFAFTIFITGLGIQHEALLSRQMRFATLAVVDVASLIVGLVAALSSAWYGAGFWALVINQVVASLVRVSGVWIVCRWRPGLPGPRLRSREMISYGGQLTGFNLAQYFARNLDNALIGKFWGAQQLGLYAKAYQLLLLPLDQINGPLGTVAIPALSRLAESPERYRKAYLKILERLAMLTMPAVAFMIATSDWLVLLLLGPQWQQTGRIFMLLGMAAFIQPITRTCWWLFVSQGRSRDMLRAGVLSSAVSVASIVFGLPWGAMGVATAYGASELFLTGPIIFWLAARRGPVRIGDFYKTIAPAASAALCALAIVLISRPWLQEFQLAMRIVLAFGMTTGASFAILAILPAGRAAMQNSKETLLLLIGARKNAVAP